MEREAGICQNADCAIKLNTWRSFKHQGKKRRKEEESNVQKSDSLSEINASIIFLKDYDNSRYFSVWSKKYNYSSNRVFSWLAILLDSAITNICYLHCLCPQCQHISVRQPLFRFMELNYHCVNMTWWGSTFAPKIFFTFLCSDPFHGNHLAASWWLDFILICLQLPWFGSLDNYTNIVMTKTSKWDQAIERRRERAHYYQWQYIAWE